MVSTEKHIGVQVLLDAVHSFLIPHGFDRISESAWWLDKKWKADMVDITLRKAQPAFLISVRVAIPHLAPEVPKPALSTEDCLYLAQDNLPQIVGKTNVFKRVPRVPLLRNRVIRRVIQDLQKGFRWLEQFETPQSCLRNLGTYWDPASEGYQRIAIYLESLVE